jgi:hypothetical protein
LTKECVIQFVPMIPKLMGILVVRGVALRLR